MAAADQRQRRRRIGDGGGGSAMDRGSATAADQRRRRIGDGGVGGDGPAPSGRVAAKYPPNREWEDMRTRRRKYFPSGMGAIFGAMVMWGVSVVLRDLLDLGEL